MVLEKRITCAKCNKVIDLSDIRADVNGRDWVCLDCYNKQHPKKKVREVDKEIKYLKPTKIDFEDDKKLNVTKQNIMKFEDVKKPDMIKRNIDRQNLERIRFKCAKCKYSFLITPGNIPRLCPYCGKDGTVVKDVNAASILKEVEDDFRFYSKT